MAHESQFNFVKSVRKNFPAYFNGVKVLEIGSLNINGSVRQFFTNCDYIGVDLGAGKDVDLICKGHLVPFEDNSFDTVISCECFEHDKDWELTFQKMWDVAKGIVIVSCASEGRPEHGTTRTSPADAPFTNDYYRNLTALDFMNTFDIFSMFDKFQFSINQAPSDLYFWGIKRESINSL